MKTDKTLFFVLIATIFLGCNGKKAIDLTQFVDPFIGTAFTGHTYPGATTPFGMVQVGPDNGISGWEFCSGYHNNSKTIMGFSHTHLSGTGASDMGDILFMPVVGRVPFTAGTEEVPSTGYRSSFSHDSEQASPGYYRVKLNDYKILAEMTATPRVGLHRYTYPSSEKSGIMIDLEHGIGDRTTESYIKVIDSQTVVGMRRSSGFVRDHRYYFCARFSKPFEQVISYQDGMVADKEEIAGKITKMLVQFSTTNQEAVKVKVGLSTASEKGAVNNLDAEVPGWDFDAVHKQTEALWNNYLKRIDIKAMDDDQRISFYTSLYHALLMPNLVTDVDGSYSGWDHQLHKSTVGDMYTNFSLWDTYRTEHPFLEIMYLEENSRFVRSLLERYRQTGLLVTNEYGMCETWCMIGNHAIPVIVDAYLKGDTTFNPEFAYEAVKHAQTLEHNKADWSNYDKLGYFPYDISSEESVSRTMESGYDDYCVAQMAKKMGKDEDYEFFMNRSKFYKNLFDPEYKLARPRDSEGNWKTPFDPYALTNKTGKRDYTEGNAWQWTWHVQQDVPGLINLFGTKEAFVQKLDSLFFVDVDSLPGHVEIPDVTGLIGSYAHGNEPSHHIAYLYNYAGRPDKTAEIVREVFDKYYLPKRDGLCGNDDCGQMSAWYMFSAFGFYSVDPVSGEYIFGAPQVHEATLHLPNGKAFTIKANNLSVENKYVKSVRLNGKTIAYTSIKYENIRNGGTLEFDMTDNKK
ncbi:MAG: GH92 family glycosyl hydrolase [Prolixibacteraceae bacterium]|jgi:predicted alpha-1,2-mannosidase